MLVRVAGRVRLVLSLGAQRRAVGSGGWRACVAGDGVCIGGRARCVVLQPAQGAWDQFCKG